jgi:hypothetical protein
VLPDLQAYGGIEWVRCGISVAWERNFPKVRFRIKISRRILSALSNQVFRPELVVAEICESFLCMLPSPARKGQLADVALSRPITPGHSEMGIAAIPAIQIEVATFAWRTVYRIKTVKLN